MTLHQIFESIEWRVVVGFLCLELVLLWLKWVDEAPILPEPNETCIANGEPMHYVRTAEWNVSEGRVRHDIETFITTTENIK